MTVETGFSPSKDEAKSIVSKRKTPLWTRLGLKKESRDLTGDEKEVRALFLSLFRFSQGNPQLQKNLLFWIKQKGYLTDLPVPEKMPSYIKEMTPPKTHAPIEGEKIFSRWTARAEKNMALKEQWNNFRAVATGDRAMMSPPSPTDLLDKMIEIEEKYQRQGRPRQVPEGQTDIQPDSGKDIHASLLRKYCLQRRRTGTVAFDALFEDLQQPFFEAIRDPLNTPAKNLVTLWENNHPGESFVPAFRETA